MPEQLSLDFESVKEEWRGISGYEGAYEVSQLGRVRSWIVLGKQTSSRARTPRQLKGYISSSGGYVIVKLRGGGNARDIGVHVLVLETFVGPRPDGMQAAHWDGDPINNHLNNLRWAAPVENQADRARHGRTIRGVAQHRSKFTEAEIRDIRGARRLGETTVSLGRRYQTDSSNISAICGGKTWKHVSEQEQAVLAALED